MTTGSDTTMDEYKVRLDIFEGPMDLLLHLIKIHEMDITEVAIAKITDEYLAHLRLMEKLDLELAGDFLVMAATLINIKLRTLLPRHGEEEVEEEEIDDLMTAKSLMEKLVEYRKFKEASNRLRDQGDHQADVFFRDAPLPRADGSEQAVEMQIDVDRLLEAFGRVLRFVEAKNWHLVAEEKFSVEEKMDEIEQRLLLEPRLSVEEVFKACRSKLEMIVYLLAMLELTHLKRLRISQTEAYGSIYVQASKEIELGSDADSDRDPGKSLDDPAAEPLAPPAEIIDLSASNGSDIPDS